MTTRRGASRSIHLCFFFLNFGWGKSPPTLGTRHDVAIVAVPCYPLYVPPRYAHPLAQGECSHFLCEKVFQKNDRFLKHIAREKNGAVATFELLKKRLT